MERREYTKNAYRIEPLNFQAQLLQELQTEIKVVIKNGVFAGKNVVVIKSEVSQIVRKTLKRITNKQLKETAEKSLFLFAERCYKRFIAELGIKGGLLAAVVLLMKKKPNADGEIIPETKAEIAASEIVRKTAPKYITTEKGLPLQEFTKTYFKRVNDALDNLADEYAVDPDDTAGRNSLRNKAEMLVRYENHQQEIEDLRASGEKLVVCSAHADCSDRCKDYQGRVYSLDGTSGKTPDGRDFVPLEVATDIFYTTKAGKKYKNGLLGFNCRHKLFPYKVGMGIPTVSEEVREREYAITKEQRERERKVLYYREQAEIYQGVNDSKARQAKRNAKAAYEDYKEFSRRNERAFYPDRTKI